VGEDGPLLGSEKYTVGWFKSIFCLNEALGAIPSFRERPLPGAGCALVSQDPGTGVLPSPLGCLVPEFVPRLTQSASTLGQNPLGDSRVILTFPTGGPSWSRCGEAVFSL